MKKILTSFSEYALLFVVSFAALVLAPLFMEVINFNEAKVFAAEEEQRAPPEARSSQTLSRRVYQIVLNVMEFQELEDYPSALLELDEVKEMYDEDRLNDVEKFTMWQFYAVIAQAEGDYAKTIDYFYEMLNLGDEVLTQDQLENTLKSIGSLNFYLERYDDAIETYIRYNDVAFEPDADVYLSIGSAYYQLEQYGEGIPYILRNMELLRANDEAVKESTYNILKSMYLLVEDYDEVLQIVREMIVLFNNSDDWPFKASLESELELMAEQGKTYYVANVMGYLESGTNLRNLAYYLYSVDSPYQAGLVMEKGISDGLLDADESNLSFLSQCFQAAREDERALAPLREAAEISEDGENYIRLGVIYSNMNNYASAVDAFNLALDKADLDRPDQVQIRLARAYLQLDRFDEGIVAVKEAAKDERSEATSETWLKLLESEKRKYDVLEANRILYDGYFR